MSSNEGARLFTNQGSKARLIHKTESERRKTILSSLSDPFSSSCLLFSYSTREAPDRPLISANELTLTRTVQLSSLQNIEQSRYPEKLSCSIHRCLEEGDWKNFKRLTHLAYLKPLAFDLMLQRYIRVYREADGENKNTRNAYMKGPNWID